MLFTLDLETSVNCSDENRMSATPHYDGNKVVLSGWADGDGVYISHNVDDLIRTLEYYCENEDNIVLCGFNIGFDLAYLLREQWFREVLTRYRNEIRVWDAQQAEYLISGQSWTYPSLDEACRRRGLPVKPDKIKEYWKSGVKTEDIPYAELAEYLEHDVGVTEKLARLQVAEMPERMRQLCFDKGDDILCTTIMEHVGMHFDLDKCADISSDLRTDILDVQAKLVDLVRSEAGYQYFQPTRTKEVQVVLYGGEFEWDEKEESGVYKTGLKKGQVKYKKVTRKLAFDGILSPKTQREVKEKFGDSVSDSVFQWIVEHEHPENWAVGQFVGYMQNFREWHKDVSTYYDGYSALVWEDGMIRPNFQHCATRTGRQSCTQPNLQNVSKGE